MTWVIRWPIRLFVSCLPIFNNEKLIKNICSTNITTLTLLTNLRVLLSKLMCLFDLYSMYIVGSDTGISASVTWGPEYLVRIWRNGEKIRTS